MTSEPSIISPQVPVLPAGNRILINHLTYNVQNISNSNAFQRLYDHICVAAYDNSDQVDQTKCLAGTRTFLLERLKNWLSAPGNARRLLTWLDGPMGSGKTAVARTMAEGVSAMNKLMGIFIFRRGQPGRNDATRFVATLAYQMALSIPLVRPYIEEQLNHDPSVLQQSLSRQLDALILEPLRRMRSQNPEIDLATLPNLIIVDGLDECGADQESGKEEMQTRVLDLIHRLALSQDVLPFAVLIHSRPEKNIKNWFSLESHEKMTNRLTLDASYKPDDDIRFFVTQSFLAILDGHPSRELLPPGWPYKVTDPDGVAWKPVETLVERSSGQFIYAAIVMKFIASQHCRPDKRLLSVLSSNDHHSPDAPNAIIDSLYVQVLNSTDDHETVKQILAFQNIAYGRYNFPPVPLARILSVLSISEQDFHHSLQQLKSLVTMRRPFLKFHHSSFGEFLENPTRSAAWFIDNKHYRLHFTLCALRLFRDEMYVGAQISFLRLVGQLSMAPHELSVELYRELEHFCDFPNSSYAASVERFLSQVPLSTFIKLARLISPLPFESPPACSSRGYTLFRHLAALIKPHIQPHLEDPDSFARFLCWAAYVPGSRLSTQGHNDALSSHRWPGDLRHIVLIVTVLMDEYGIVSCLPDRQFYILFSIPSMSFLNRSLLIVLKSLEPGLRHSRRWNYQLQEVCWKGPRDREIFKNIFRGMDVSPDIWIYVLDCQQTLQDDFRTNIQEFLNFGDESYNERNQFRCLHNLQPPQDSGAVSPLDSALADSTWNVERSWLRLPYWFLRSHQYTQILIPSIPELAIYLALPNDVRCIFDPPIPVKASLCDCGWADFIPLGTDV